MNASTNDLETKLSELCELIQNRQASIERNEPWSYPSGIVRLIQQLAAKRFPPARGYFLDLLLARYGSLEDEILLNLVGAIGFNWTDTVEVIPVIESFLRDERRDEQLRVTSAAVLGSMRSETSIPLLAKILTSPHEMDDFLKDATLTSLIEMGSDYSITQKLQERLPLDAAARFAFVQNLTNLKQVISEIVAENGSDKHW